MHDTTDKKTDFHLVITEKVLREAKKRAIDAGVPLKDVIEVLLDHWARGKIKVKIPPLAE